MDQLVFFWYALFGRAARRATFDYLLITVLITFLLLAIAWTVDLASAFPDMRAEADERGISVLRILGPYLTYRSTDMVIRLFPVACFFGIFISEILRRVRLETVVLSAVGSSPLRSLGPLLIFGLIWGALTYQIESTWRPNAIKAQVELGHGAYAHRFAPNWQHGASWFLYGDIAIQGEVFRGRPPAMRNVLIFEGLQAERLRSALKIERLDPTETDGIWQLSGVTLWQADQEGSSGVPVPDRTMVLPIKPEELTHHEIPGFYLPSEPLRALAKAHRGSQAQVWAEVALWRRAVIWLVPFAVGALALCLVRLGFIGRLLNVPRLIAAGATGYICVVSLKVFFAIGEIGGLSGGAATLGPILILLAISALLTWRAS